MLSRVARQKTSLLQRSAQFGVELDKSPRDAQPDGAGLSCRTAAVSQHQDVEPIRHFHRSQRLLHGKTSVVEHDGRGVFAGLPQGFEVGRYHSLAATTVPDDLVISARSDDGEVMGVRHRELPVEGVQFHPESVLTPLGKDLLRNFLESSPPRRVAGQGVEA